LNILRKSLVVISRKLSYSMTRIKTEYFFHIALIIHEDI